MSVTAPALEPFVTADELRAVLNLPGMTDEQAWWLADWGSGAVRAEVGQIVNVVEDDEVVLNGSGGPLMLLPELAVRNVASVILGDRELSPGEYEWDSAGCLWRLAQGLSGGWSREVATGRWPWAPRSVRVTYDHGWDPDTPQWHAARQVTLEIAAKTFRNPEGMQLQSERIGDWSRSWMPTGGGSELLGEMSRRSLDILRPGR